MGKSKSSKGKFYGSYLASEEDRIDDEAEDKLIKRLEKTLKKNERGRMNIKWKEYLNY